ncbi:GAF domain-containing protein [Phytophthora infestans T30-4]|uniref:GAF domain-containing protein n=1 Tax=Phytophthora infestans (strain T30-4) TaxID=403677 RepID=D0P3Q2_PHYIT|nr:GAF domain-containing protein [Phytophthora infestans T30-4]EEY60494.1 GAF domain-containing protein [Phytophthora infestans T30-4]|eukprot:XP_002895071.1 GAF domain-containing protein [Phytophthora infestans T30-4]
MLNASYSYESGESSAAYEHNSQRSEEPPPAVESMMESARLSDKRLHEVAAAAVSSVNWGELDMELAAASLSEKHESVWKRKKSPRGYANSDAMKLFTRLTVRDRRHQTRWGPKGFAVLAEGTLPCTVQEMRLVFRVASTDMFRDMMRCIYRREFVEGEQLRTIRIQRSAGNPARAFENRELSVKTATFESGGLFSKNESWCFLELLHPRDRAKEEQSTRRTASSTASAISATPPPSFTRTLVSIARSSVVLDNALAPPPRSTPHVPNVVINYSFEEDPSGRATRVVFHGEYLPPDALDAFKRAGHERRLARLWLLRLAASCHRFLLVVRRRRLGMQVIINSTRLPLETVANVPRCACCRRSFSTFFKRTRKRLCYPMEAIIPPIPSNEYKRLELIRQQQLNELGDVPELGIICSLASKELACAVSMITVVDKAQLHVLASTHPAVPGGMSYPREQGFCAQTILDPHPLVSRHVQADVRFSALSSVRKMGINFYCGFPLMGPDGKTVIGSVCCADPQARDLTRSQYAAMSSLASTASRVVQRAAERRAVREGSADV